MKKQTALMIAAIAFMAFVVAGCGGGGGGAVTTVQAKGGEKLCLPQSSWKSTSQYTDTALEEYRTLQGAVDFADVADGEIVVVFSEGHVPSPTGTEEVAAMASKGLFRSLQQDSATTYDANTTYFYFVAVGSRGTSCGEYMAFGYGEVDSANGMSIMEQEYTDSYGATQTYRMAFGSDQCGSFDFDFTGTRTDMSAYGSLDIPVPTSSAPAAPARAAGQTSSTTYEGSWSAANLNCVRIEQSGAVAPTTISLAPGQQIELGALLYDMTCNPVAPIDEPNSDAPMLSWDLDNGTSVSSAGSYSIVSSIGTLTDDGVFTATTSYEAVSGGVWLYYGGFYDKITITVTAADIPPDVSSNVAAARSYLFQDVVTVTDFNNAKTEIDAALVEAPNDPDANLLNALIELGGEYERWISEVEYTAETEFPYSVSYRAMARMYDTALSPVTDFVTQAYPKKASRFSAEDPENSEVQTEVETNVLDVINEVVASLEKVKSHIDTDSSWVFAYPKDVAYPSLGDNYIDSSDIKALLGAVYFAKGWLNYGLAYQCDFDEDTWDMTDTDSSGVYEPDEQFPNTACGTLRTNGASYLSTAQTYVASGLDLLDEALTEILQEAIPAMGGEAFESSDIADLQHYQSYVGQLAASFGGTATSITMPAEVECYREYNYGNWSYYEDDTIFDPDYNTDETVGCAALFTTHAALTVSVNYGALFYPVVSDLRSLQPNLVIDQDTDITFVESSGGSPVLPDSTLNGMFPGGVQASWFDMNEPTYHFDFYLFDSNGQPMDCSGGVTDVTLTIGSDTLTAYGCDGHYVNGVWTTNVLCFYNEDFGTLGLPQAGDEITINALVGTQMTIDGPGFEPVMLITDSNRMSANVTVVMSTVP